MMNRTDTRHIIGYATRDYRGALILHDTPADALTAANLHPVTALALLEDGTTADLPFHGFLFEGMVWDAFDPQPWGIDLDARLLWEMDDDATRDRFGYGG